MDSYSILIVDDQSDNFEVIEAFLISVNYTLHYARNGQEAIAFLDKCEPDLILLDVMMPDIDGIEVCKSIKMMTKWQAVPIIMVTALTGATELARCLEAGADDFISKPIGRIELRARVKSMLRIKKQHDRIESLSKLQRNSINSLKSDLNELKSDLSMSFAAESDAFLKNIVGKTSALQENLGAMTKAEIMEVLTQVNQSAAALDKCQQKLLFGQQLSSPKKASQHQLTCFSKISIEQIVTKQIYQLQSASKLLIDVEDTELAIAPKHLQYIFCELLSHILKLSDYKGSVNIHGNIMNDEFHCYVDNHVADMNHACDVKISESIQFNPASNSEKELSTSLKIAKKIVEIHDGLFLVSNITETEKILYITLPLSRNADLLKPVVNTVNSVAGHSGCISDELQNSPEQFSFAY
jgi:two-component system, sensor histidine kinase and response regulator